MRKCRSAIAVMLAFFALWSISCGSETAVEKKAEKSAPAAPADSELLALLPAKGAVAGWAMTDEPRYFGPGNLWEFIDGAADGYLAYGFQEVVTSDYAREGTEDQAVIDIYRMKDPLNAFGIYAQEQSPGSEYLDIGNEGYLGGTALNFWTGPYYVKITVFEEKEELGKQMRDLAHYVAGRIPDRGSVPVQTGYFPSGNMVPHSVKYLPRDVLGQSYLENGFEAGYRNGGAEYKIVLIEAENADAAKEQLGRYRSFITDSGETKDVRTPGEEGFSGKDGFYGNMVAVRSDRRIAVALGVPSYEAGTRVLTELLGNIR